VEIVAIGLVFFFSISAQWIAGKAIRGGLSKMGLEYGNRGLGKV
jgi:hypothetical protein